MKRRSASAKSHALNSWRDVVTPHEDVIAGDFTRAEFAADLWQVHLGLASSEYQDPVEFFRRTYLTSGMTRLLDSAARRLAGQGGGDPVVRLQTGFGGGKTHTLLALYHLFGDVRSTELAGISRELSALRTADAPRVRRVVLVGSKFSPGNPLVKSDGTIVRTLWGEIAWQLGGAVAFQHIAEDDQQGTSPGDRLRELLVEYGPCLILIDEWVAYARQLHEAHSLPGGTLATQVSFAQALTESATLAPHCLLVVSLPAPTSSALDSVGGSSEIELGGEGGRLALERLRAVIGRVETAWAPASRDELRAIVCHRLITMSDDPERRRRREAIVSALGGLYHAHRDLLPPECGEAEYARRLEAFYPFHPELLDRLFVDWSTIESFQGIRGVLRCLAEVVQQLWRSGDPAPLILPGTIPLAEARVRFEMRRHLPESWDPLLDQDVDGPAACATRLDQQVPILGKLSACRRVARTIALASAPGVGGSERGVDARRIHLGCLLPGDGPAVFDDALRRLSFESNYLYQDQARWWYAPQPTVTRLGTDRAEQLRQVPERAVIEVESRLRRDIQMLGDFHGVSVFPESASDVPDVPEAHLVILRLPQPTPGLDGQNLQQAAETILASCSGAPRRYRNALVFLAADPARWSDLEAATRRYLAWESILAEQVAMALTPAQIAQASAQRTVADQIVAAQIPETFHRLLVPTQVAPGAALQWRELRTTGHGPLASRAAKKLIAEELLLTHLSGTRLRLELDRVPLWRGNHVEVRQLGEDFACCVYLPRLRDVEVLRTAVRDGVGLLTWASEGLAVAQDWDAASHRYSNLRCGQALVADAIHLDSLVVRPDAIADRRPSVGAGVRMEAAPTPADSPVEGTPTDSPPTHFRARIRLEPGRVGPVSRTVDDEVVALLAGLSGAHVAMSLEIDVKVPSGIPPDIVRAVRENCQTLRVADHRFEGQ